jgi:hypothetical protein
MQLIDRVLPILLQVVDQRAAAVEAAEDVWNAALERQNAGQRDIPMLLAGSESLLRQRRAFIRTVCEYNQKIAEYGLTVAAPGVNPQTLVAMLIETQSDSPMSTMARAGDNGVGRGIMEGTGATTYSAGQQENAISNTQWSSSPSSRVPTRAKRPDPATQKQDSDALDNGSTDAPAANEATPNDAPRQVQQTQYEEQPPAVPPQPVGEPNAADQKPSLTPVKPQADVPILQSAPPKLEAFPRLSVEPSHTITTRKPAVEGTDSQHNLQAVSVAAGESASVPLYSAFEKTTPAGMAKQLTLALHVDRPQPDATSRPMKLSDSLTYNGSRDTKATIEAFWQVREHAAQRQSLIQQVGWLESLTPIVLEHRQQPSGVVDMLRLHAATLAAKAAVRESQAGLVEAQCLLAGQTGTLADPAWPIAVTPPHSGTYLLKLESQPRNLAASWPVRRLAARIPALGESVQQRAAAVIEADSARCSTVEAYRAAGTSIEPVLQSIRQQADQTTEFLETLTDYNIAIANYAMAVLPPGTPPEKLAVTLVVNP